MDMHVVSVNVSFTESLSDYHSSIKQNRVAFKAVYRLELVSIGIFDFYSIFL